VAHSAQHDDDPPASALARVFLQEDLNFLVTNRIPRRLVTRAIGRVSRIHNPTFARVAIRVWRLFADDLGLHEAEHTRFASLQDCFTRRLRPNARPVDQDPDVLVSPCDAIVGEAGTVERGRVYQAKGFPYRLDELVADPIAAHELEGGRYVTLRLKANMYHRFHAPASATLRRVTYVSGDTWNVNPIALRRVERLFCRNERVVFDMASPGARVVLVAVAAIGVATVRVHALGARLDLKYRGPNLFEIAHQVARGEELGFFEAGSTIIVFVPTTHDLVVREGDSIRMGTPLFCLRRGDP
jgi:phosphatidylserine decarboxylase